MAALTTAQRDHIRECRDAAAAAIARNDRKPPAAEALDRLHEKISQLDSNLDSLHSRLNPVILQRPFAGPQAEGDVPPHSELVRAILAAAERLEVLSQRVCDIQNGLEV